MRKPWRTGISATMLGAFIAAAITGGGAAAQTVMSDAIIDALQPSKAGPVVRSMSPQAKRGIQISGHLPPEVDLPKIALTINFDLDSARLTTDGMIALRSLAKALIDPRLANMTFQVAGHTDGRGEALYNQTLSERRAQAVVRHLNTFYEIPIGRLTPIGYGVTRPLDPANIMNPVNRRVEIVNTAPLS